MSNEEAIEAMGDMSIHDLMHPDLFDDDFVNDGDPKYKLIHDAHMKYSKRAQKYQHAKEKMDEEKDELHAAEKKEKTLKNVMEQKKAELTDAKQNVNATGTQDEEAELDVAEKHLEEVKAEEEELMDEIESDAAIMKEAREKLPELNEKLSALRAEHGEKYQADLAAREKYGEVTELLDRRKTVESELEKVARIEEKLKEEKDNVTATLNGPMGQDAAELLKAEEELAEVSKKIAETEAEIEKYTSRLHESEERVKDAQRTKLPGLQGETIHAEEQVKSAEDDLHQAQETFNQDEYDEAVADEKQVEQEIVEAKEEAGAAADTVEEKEADVEEAEEKTESTQDVVSDAVDEVHKAEEALDAPPAPAPMDPEEMEGNNPEHWAGEGH